MPNHFHLLLEVHRFPTARILQSLLTGYARRFNKVHGRRGHLFEGRYKAIVCDRDSYLLELVRYIHLNPVRASLVKRPSEWQWSGHGEYLGKQKRELIDSGLVIGQLRPPAHYELFIRDGAKVNYRAEWHPGDGAPFLGPGRFVKTIAKESIPPPSSRRITLEDLLKSAAAKSGLSAEILLRKGRLGSVVNARGSICPRRPITAWLSRLPSRLFSQLPSIQCQSCTAKKLIDLGKSVIIAVFLSHRRLQAHQLQQSGIRQAHRRGTTHRRSEKARRDSASGGPHSDGRRPVRAALHARGTLRCDAKRSLEGLTGR
jgi:hypothetical protein